MDFMVSNFCDEEHGNVFNTARNATETRCMLLGSNELIDNENENRLPPEMELGNIEYKAKLICPSSSRLEHLITQLKWRLSEGLGEAIYELGVEDDGRMVGLTDDEFEGSMHTLRSMADALSADIVECTEREVCAGRPHSSIGKNCGGGEGEGAQFEEVDSGLSGGEGEGGSDGERRRVAEVLIRRVPESQPFIESRLAMLGGPDVGKSTLCGVLTHQALDDGNGKTRLNQFRYLHEVQTGKTSSVCVDMLAFDSKGKVLNYSTSCVTEMAEHATKVVHLIDLAGDAKYLRTTIYGLSAYAPAACCLIVSALTGPTAATREHLALAVALSLPVFVVITKRDAVERPKLKTVFTSVERLLKRTGVHARIQRVKTKRDAVRAASQLMCADIAVPVMSVSSVTGEGMRPLRSLLNALAPAAAVAQRRAELREKPPLFVVEEHFQVPHVGTVACGVLSEGSLRIRERVAVGPSREGLWRVAAVGSVRRSKLPVLTVNPGEAVSLSLLPCDDSDDPLVLRRGMVIQSVEAERLSYQRVAVSLLLLTHSATVITEGFEATFFIGAVRQTARVENIERGEDGEEDGERGKLRTGQWCSATIRFLSSHEFIRIGTPLIFRLGKTRGMGEVTGVFED